MEKTILLVDDAGVLRHVGMLVLRRHGYDVVLAVDGRDALKKLDETGVDLIVTDINMPEMDGIELIREVRKRDDHRFTPIIVLSTISQEEKLLEGREAGASGWLFKPFNAMQLLSAVRRFI